MTQKLAQELLEYYKPILVGKKIKNSTGNLLTILDLEVRPISSYSWDVFVTFPVNHPDFPKGDFQVGEIDPVLIHQIDVVKPLYQLVYQG